MTKPITLLPDQMFEGRALSISASSLQTMIKPLMIGFGRGFDSQ